VRLPTDGGVHLGYCTNIHPANGWTEVFASLEAHAPALKQRLGVDGPFGLGLRLSGAESRELLEGGELARLRAWLDAQGLYVFTINGFPHGAFHGQRVKDDVHAPDWRSPERVAYTLRLAEILAELLPEGVEGGISTSPLSYVGWIDREDPELWRRCAQQVARVAEGLVRRAQRDGTVIHVDIEPEADGLLADCAELVDFYSGHLLTEGAATLAGALGCSQDEAREHLRRHVRVCFDACHAAVAYEDPAQALDLLDGAGIRVGKVQLSAALSVPLADAPADREQAERALRTLADPVYLHQVAQRNVDGGFVHYADLPEALPCIHDPAAAEWRVHFHVPLFVEQYAGLRSTQAQLRRVLELVRERGVADHLEIETYTWQVLPPELKAELVESIGREYDWVLDVLA